MGVIKIDDIKDQIEELVSRAEAGETILIEKDGRTVARIEGVVGAEAPHDGPQRKIDITALRELTQSQPMQTESAADFIRRMRNEDRY
jgi:antitoxin (DNA-binding transcriptional repressor) of toxin-antitoxin stability system